MELLVVVAIIALLIAILLPALRGAKLQAFQLKCLTNLRTLGHAAQYYAEANRNTVLRAEYRPPPFPKGDPNNHLHFSQTLLLGLPTWEGPMYALWKPVKQDPLIKVLRQTPYFQCPTFPPSAQKDPNEQALDYVTSAFVLPYTKLNEQVDSAGGGQPGSTYKSVDQSDTDSVSWFRLDQIDRRTSPARMIHLTEAHATLPVDDLQFHDVFLTSQLPLGAFPRIAGDLRHPGGINALFFDGHAETMRHARMDSGWPHEVADRLRWFTYYLDE